MAVSEASVVMDRVAWQIGWMRRVALAMAFLTSSTAVSISLVTVNSFLEKDKKPVRGRIMYKAGIKVYHTLYIQLAGGGRELHDGGDLLLEGADAFGFHLVPEEDDGGFG